MLTSYKKPKSYLSVQNIILYLISLHIKHKENKINSYYENKWLLSVLTPMTVIITITSLYTFWTPCLFVLIHDLNCCILGHGSKLRKRIRATRGNKVGTSSPPPRILEKTPTQVSLILFSTKSPFSTLDVLAPQTRNTKIPPCGPHPWTLKSHMPFRLWSLPITEFPLKVQW